MEYERCHDIVDKSISEVNDAFSLFCINCMLVVEAIHVE